MHPIPAKNLFLLRYTAAKRVWASKPKNFFLALCRHFVLQNRPNLSNHPASRIVQYNEINQFQEACIMLNTPIAIDVPLHTDADGVIRVSHTRVTLYTLIGFFNQGESPEALHEGFPTVPLADIYAVIAYYLAHREAVDAYLRQVDEEADEIRQKWETLKPPVTKAELQARLNASKEDT